MDVAGKCVKRTDVSQGLCVCPCGNMLLRFSFFLTCVILSSSWKFSRSICKASQRENLLCLGPGCHSDELFGEIGSGKWVTVKSNRQLQCPITLTGLGIIGSSHTFHWVAISECCSSKRITQPLVNYPYVTFISISSNVCLVHPRQLAPLPAPHSCKYHVCGFADTVFLPGMPCFSSLGMSDTARAFLPHGHYSLLVHVCRFSLLTHH